MTVFVQVLLHNSECKRLWVALEGRHGVRSRQPRPSLATGCCLSGLSHPSGTCEETCGGATGQDHCAANISVESSASKHARSSKQGTPVDVQQVDLRQRASYMLHAHFAGAVRAAGGGGEGATSYGKSRRQLLALGEASSDVKSFKTEREAVRGRASP